MSGVLFGQERSGTSIETREGTTKVADSILSGGRLASGADSLGFDASSGIEAVIERLFADPASRLEGLFSALEPFNRRDEENAAAGVRGSFGRLGGRFSSNVLDAESQVRGEVAGNQARVREQSILEVGGQQQQLVATLLQALLQGRGQTLDFFHPGGSQFQPGLLSDLIGAGGALAASRI